MGHMSGRIVIERSPENVFEGVLDEPSWNPAMTTVEWLTPPPIDVGTRYSVTMNGGMRMAVEVVEFQRPTLIRSRTESSFMTTDGTVTVAPCPEGALLRWDWDYDLRGGFRLLSPLFSGSRSRWERRNWGRLKEFLETDATAT